MSFNILPALHAKSMRISIVIGDEQQLVIHGNFTIYSGTLTILAGGELLLL